MTTPASTAALATSVLTKPAPWTATQRLHNAELALHDARTTNVDAWITAAADRLHDAVENYLRSLTV